MPSSSYGLYDTYQPDDFAGAQYQRDNLASQLCKIAVKFEADKDKEHSKLNTKIRTLENENENLRAETYKLWAENSVANLKAQLAEQNQEKLRIETNERQLRMEREVDEMKEQLNAADDTITLLSREVIALRFLLSDSLSYATTKSKQFNTSAIKLARMEKLLTLQTTEAPATEGPTLEMKDQHKHVEKQQADANAQPARDESQINEKQDIIRAKDAGIVLESAPDKTEYEKENLAPDGVAEELSAECSIKEGVSDRIDKSFAGTPEQTTELVDKDSISQEDVATDMKEGTVSEESSNDKDRSCMGEETQILEDGTWSESHSGDESAAAMEEIEDEIPTSVTEEGLEEHFTTAVLASLETLDCKQQFFDAAASGDREALDRILSPSCSFAASLPEIFGAALCIAAKQGRAEICATLLAFDANIEHPGEKGCRPLHAACSCPWGESSVKLLLESKADPEAVDENEQTVLHHSCQNNNIEALKLLMQQGVSIWAEDTSGLTAEDLATEDAFEVLQDPTNLFWNDAAMARAIYIRGDWEQAQEVYGRALERVEQCSPRPTEFNIAILHLNRAKSAGKLGKYVQVVEDCGRAMELRPNYTTAMQERAQAYMKLYAFPEAVSDLQAAKADTSNDEWSDLLREAQRMDSKSHYYWLEITEQELEEDSDVLKRAYKRQCLQWHPDKNQSDPESAAQAANMFRRINEAYKVLKDPVQRVLYTNPLLSSSSIRRPYRDHYATDDFTF